MSSKLTLQIVRPLCIVLGLICLCADGKALSIETSEGVLRSGKLDVHEDSLLGYLTNGIPSEASVSALERWEKYGHAAIVLGQQKSQKAVPLLIERIQSPLPSQLQNDLELKVAGHLGNASWEDWDRDIFIKTIDFRSTCALALANIGDEKALSVVAEYLKSVTPDITAAFEKEDVDDPKLFHSYASICKSITAFGSKDGIDALIEVLDQLINRSNGDILIYTLRICTGQAFGPESDTPVHRRQSEIGKWKEWWSQNRDSYQIDRKQVLNATKPNLPTLVPQTVRDHVVLAKSRFFDYEGSGEGKASAEWLEANGKRNVKALAAIMNDEDELAGVRREAMQWYAQFGGKRALALLTEYATSDARYRGYSGHITKDLFQTEALKLIEKHFPDDVDDVARQCAAESDNAVFILMKKSDNWKFVADNYHSFSHDVQLMAIQKLLEIPEPVGRDVFVDAIKDADLNIAGYAAKGIQKFALREELPTESAKALDKWEAVQSIKKPPAPSTEPGTDFPKISEPR